MQIGNRLSHVQRHAPTAAVIEGEAECITCMCVQPGAVLQAAFGLEQSGERSTLQPGNSLIVPAQLVLQIWVG